MLNGIPEKKDEIVLDVAVKYLKNIDSAFNKNAIECAYTMGKNELDRKGNRVMVVRFKNVDVKRELLKKKAAMKNKKLLGKVFYNDDLPDHTRKIIQEMREIASYAKKIGFEDAKVSGQKLFVGGKSYSEDELFLLPERIRLENIKTRPIGEGIGFQSKYSYLSNFYPCKIVINNMSFTSAEQAFYYYKAIVGERDDSALKIKSISDPEKIKKYGDKMDTCPEWQEQKVAYMKCIATHKFKQNLELKAKLLGTAGMELIECTTDRFWGSGRRFDSLEWTKTPKYEGRNMMGKILEGIRGELDTRALNSSSTSGIEGFNLPFPPSGSSSSSKQGDENSTTKKGTNEPQSVMENPKPSSRELCATIKPTVLESASPMALSTQTQTRKSSHTIEEDLADQKCLTKPSNSSGVISKASNLSGSNEELMDIEGVDAVSVSSVFSELSETNINDVKDLTNEDGSLNLQKIAGWTLPPLNTSKLLGLSRRGDKEAKERLRSQLKSQNELSGDYNISTSTPKEDPIKKVRNKRKSSRVKQGHVGGVKTAMTNLLSEMNLI